MKTKQDTLLDLLFIILGTGISAFSLNMVIIPADILTSGVTGIAQIIHHFIPISVGLLFLILNIPLLYIGYRYLGKRFSIYTIISTVLLSIFLSIIPVNHIWTENILLSAIFGGVINSIGCGLVLRRGGSQGGMDVLSRVLAKYKNITIGKSNLIFNGCIIVISGFIFGSEIALYTIIYLFVSMRTYDMILNHVNRMTLIIVSEKGEDIGEAIMNGLKRGITFWNSNGGYTLQNKKVVLCVINKGELQQIRKIVRTTDPKAFVTILDTKNVIGRFHDIW